MVSSKIKSAIEADLRLAEDLNNNGFGSDWKKFNRTTFEFIARRINKIVSSKISIAPFLVTEKLIIGQDYLSKMLFEKKAKDEESLIHMIANMMRPFNWISGKTLQSYWNGGKAKETKINVLLVFLGIEISEWDKWKDARKHSSLSISGRAGRKAAKQDVLINYFLGNYFLYYQKTDGSDTLIKAPFLIEKDDNDQVVVQTITEGHLYKSTLIELREGILYIHCENQFFNDKENHIFNVGNETNPEVIFGISNTITVKSKLAIGIRNVLIKQRNGFSSMRFEEKEINLADDAKLDAEENLVRSYFLRQKTNIMTSHTCCTMDVLKKMTKEPS